MFPRIMLSVYKSKLYRNLSKYVALFRFKKIYIYKRETKLYSLKLYDAKLRKV